jgi:hypothetical protein
MLDRAALILATGSLLACGSAPEAPSRAPVVAAPPEAAAPAAVPTTGTVRGAVSFTGAPRGEAGFPRRVVDYEFCRDHPQRDDGVVVTDGKLKDVVVRIAPGAAKGPKPAEPSEPLVIFPRFGGHPERRDDAPGVFDGEEEEAAVHGCI